MPISPVSVANTATAGTTPVAAPKQTLDSEVFMKLLVAQLTNQDPSSPMDTNQMISQTTELAMMEKMTTLADNSTEAFALSMRQAATALIGKDASYLDENGKTLSGVVTKVSFDGAVPQVTIGDKLVRLDAVSGLTTPSTTAANPATA